VAWDDSWWQHHQGLVILTFFRVKNWHDAEDLVSEAYIGLLTFEGALTTPGDVENLLKWNLNNRIKDWMRSARVRYEFPEDPHDLEQRQTIEIPQHLYEYLESLPPYLANVVSGRIVHGATVREVADTLGISPYQVRRQTRVAVEHLRALAAINLS
jgi:RNA polymerase sigma factor (sigma-70 family)